MVVRDSARGLTWDVQGLFVGGEGKCDKNHLELDHSGGYTTL